MGALCGSADTALLNVPTETLSLLLLLYGLSIFPFQLRVSSLSHLSSPCTVRQCWKSCFSLAPGAITPVGEGVAFCLAALPCCWQLRCSARLYAKLNIKEAGFRKTKEKLWIGANISPITQHRVYQLKHVCCVCLSSKKHSCMNQE